MELICNRCSIPLTDEQAEIVYEDDEPYCAECKEYLEDMGDYVAEAAQEAIQENMEEARSTGN